MEKKANAHDAQCVQYTRPAKKVMERPWQFVLSRESGLWFVLTEKKKKLCLSKLIEKNKNELSELG